ncbi:MAG: hypothetical protein H6910_04895 [Rickettsiaceae bacterium]|nr:hypothetical protein [Rickettsiaceae bacterium]MCP5378437.1 hypothetical protein [Rickettsiaceae bacterium]
MFLNLLLSLMVGMICLMSWMFKRNLELDKDTQELVKKIIRTTELLNHRVSQIEEWVNSQRKVTKKLTQGKNDKNI